MKQKFFTVLFVFLLAACSGIGENLPFIDVTNTVEPTATLTPSPTSTPTLPPTYTPVPNGPCDNPLIPLRVGNRWIYRAITDNGETLYELNALERQDVGNIVTVVEFLNQKSNESVRENVVCLDGAIEDFPLFVMDMLFVDYLQNFFNTYHENGIHAPAYNSIVQNNWNMEWGANYLTEDKAYINNPMINSKLVVVESSSIVLSFKMDGAREPIKVPAGDFPQALKVTHHFSMIVTILSPTEAKGGILTVQTTQWYEPYVGLIRAQVDNASIASNMQESSAPFRNVIELVEFTQGK